VIPIFSPVAFSLVPKRIVPSFSACGARKVREKDRKSVCGKVHVGVMSREERKEERKEEEELCIHTMAELWSGGASTSGGSSASEWGWLEDMLAEEPVMLSMLVMDQSRDAH
jgi:hypothetical protein